MKPDSNRPINIEDLIRLKRAERPPAAFWAQFDRELRAKQLSALVAKRPWWQTLPAASYRMYVRFRLPLGAAAVLGAAFLSVRNYQAPSTAPEAAPSDRDHVVAISVTSDSRGFASANPTATVAIADPRRADVDLLAPVAAAVETIASSSFLPTADNSTVPHFDAAIEPTEAQASIAHRPAVTLVSAITTSSTGPHLVGAKTGFESRALPARVTVEPLQQMTSPSESRRARLLTAMVSTASLETSTRTTERAASRIAEERLYDQVQRFGARGDRLHLKF